MMRLYQSNEGITLLDATDEFEAHSYGFGGLSDMLIQFGQQLSGAAQIPMVRLFGQSPAGLNATGDSDIRNYYDFINSSQENRLRQPVQLLLDLSYRSLFGAPLPQGFNFAFSPLWQLSDVEKATVAGNVTTAIVNAQQAGIVSNPAALKELRQSSKVTGIWSNITDEEIQDAEMAPPTPQMMGEAPAGEEKPGEKAGGEAEADDGTRARNTAVLGLLPSHALSGHPSGLDKPEHVQERYKHLSPMAELRQRFPLLPAAGTPAPSGMTPDAAGIEPVFGPIEDSEAVWLIGRNDPDSGGFGGYRAMVGFADRASAVEACEADGTAITSVKRLSVAGMNAFLSEWQTSQPERLNGGAKHAD